MWRNWRISRITSRHSARSWLPTILHDHSRVLEKVLGAIAILAPRFPRLKEWAYAGIFFDLTGAAASCAAVGGYGAYAFHVIAPLTLAGLTMASWALRPESRTIGILIPLRALPRSVPLRLDVEQIASSRLSTLSAYDRFALLPTPGRAVSSSVLRCTAPAHLDASPSIH